MARNTEKQYGKLNRLILQKEKEELLQKHPKRPKLSQLNTASEIRKWLPTIGRDINFYLEQSQLVCYSDKKIMEMGNEVEKLEKEYKSFVHKLMQLDPNTTPTSSTNRPYQRQNKPIQVSDPTQEIPTPILTREIPTDTTNPIEYCNPTTMDAPLNFSSDLPPLKRRKLNSERETNELFESKHGEAVKEKTLTLFKIFNMESQKNAKFDLLSSHYYSSDEEN